MRTFSATLWIQRMAALGLFFFALYLIGQYAFPHLNGYYQIIAINAGIAVILAVSLNLINGITGQFRSVMPGLWRLALMFRPTSPRGRRATD